MNTRPLTMAAEDLTGPCVLKVHNKAGFAGSELEAIPSNDGLPRNIGQSAATPFVTINQVAKRPAVVFAQPNWDSFILRDYGAGAGFQQTVCFVEKLRIRQ